ncbi:MAG: hypothetical protein KGJ80_15510, partial [Chloroflexota bacterium]|nr:hypothetical protein [Chloroflexota bacterium]
MADQGGGVLKVVAAEGEARQKGDMKRSDEEFCRSEFDKFLRESLGKTSIVWEEVAQSSEPPDYYLQLGDYRFAVEVTSIRETIKITPSPLTATGLSAASKKFVESIEKSAVDEGILTGMYVVTLEPMDAFAEVKNLIAERILSYVRSTKDLLVAQRQVV